MSLDVKRIASFMREGQALRARLNENPLPVADHNAWVERMNAYFAELDAEEYAARLDDFSGMTFYGDGSERSRMSNSIDGRCRRLSEFIADARGNGASAAVTQSASAAESPVLILKPSFFGFGVDLRAGWKVVSEWFRRR